MRTIPTNKLLILTFLCLIGLILLVGGTYSYAAPFLYNVGGTGTTTAVSGQLRGMGKSADFGVATTTVSCSGNASCTSFVAIGASPITISASGGGGSGTVSTSTNETAGNLSYWTSNSATPALLGKVATGTVANGTGISVTAGQSIIGSGLTITNTGIVTYNAWSQPLAGQSATTSILFVQLLSGTSTLGSLVATSSITNLSVKSALVLNSAAGLEGAYGGSAPCSNQVALSLSAAGVITCTSISDAMLSSTFLKLYDAFPRQTTFNVSMSATTSQMFFSGGLFASSTSVIASTTWAGNGMVGISSSTPYGLFSINPTGVIGNSPAFVIGSSTGGTYFSITPSNSGDILDVATSTTATLNAFAIGSAGDIVTKGPKPTLQDCGTATMTATSTDMRGTVTVTGGTPATCNIKFSSVKSDTPTCVANDDSATLSTATKLASTTGVQFAMSAVFSGTIQYICMQ